MARRLPEPVSPADVLSLVPVVCVLGPSGSRTPCSQAVSLSCVSQPFLLPLAGDQEASGVPSGVTGIAEAWGGLALSPFPASWSSCWLLHGPQQAVSSPGPSCPADRSPVGLPGQRSRETSAQWNYWSRKSRKSLTLLVLVLVCAGWGPKKHGCGCGCVKGKET